jgi:hypothetical protein
VQRGRHGGRRESAAHAALVGVEPHPQTKSIPIVSPRSGAPLKPTRTPWLPRRCGPQFSRRTQRAGDWRRLVSRAGADPTLPPGYPQSGLAIPSGCITSWVGASHRQVHHLLENVSLKMSYLPVYALLCIENAPITVLNMSRWL